MLVLGVLTWCVCVGACVCLSEKVRQCCERVKTVWVESDERKLPVIVTITFIENRIQRFLSSREANAVHEGNK